MHPMRSARSTDDPRVLLVGPDRWRGRVAAVVGDDALVSAATSREGALDLLRGSADRFDCVVCAAELDDGDGTALIRALDDESVPVVLAPETGNERLARDAFVAGAADYAPLDEADETLRERIDEAVDRDAERRRCRRRAADFEALAADPDRFVAVLDSDGAVRRINRAGRRFVDADRDTVVGKRFWALPWGDGDASRRDVQRAVGRAAEGEFETVEASLAGGAEAIAMEFRLRPVDGGGDGPRRVLVVGAEVDERVRLQEELRRSEELHRVTLNNMTDTVLVTDDEGAFTYVCPNVHFIFGYTAEEIREFGTIDALLGDDAVDPDRLPADGVLTNVECTATDKAGEEHTLLVNVRRVSIQGGTTLYSCRDVTERKRREAALTQLHRTSRNLLYDETDAEIANRIVEDAASVLPDGGAAVYQFDREQNVLYPTAASESVRSFLGPLPEFSLDQRSAVTRAFVEERTMRSGDVDGDREPGESLPDFGDYVAVPLADHGVLLATAPDEGAFDGVDEEVTELLAATTEAAFDRVDRENELRERDEALQRRNRRLSDLIRVNEIIREIDQDLVNAETRAEIETAVCERLTADDRFSFAWVGETTAPDGGIEPKAWAGDERGYLDSLSLSLDGGSAPAVRAADEREEALVANVAESLRDARWRKEAVSRNLHSAFAIPLAYDGVSLGTLAVYADEPDAFDETVRTVLRELGDTIAAAINAVQRKEALHSDEVVELDYRIDDPRSPLFHLAEATGATLDVESEVTREDGSALVFATVTGAPAERVVESAADLVGIADAEVIREAEDGDSGFVGLETRDRFLTDVLADHGAVRRVLRATPDELRLVIEVPDSVRTRTVDEVVSNTFSDADLVAQRQRTRPIDAGGTEGRLGERLTDRQREVVRTAYHSGFFDEDRDVTGRDVAAVLDISHTAFYDHVRRAQRNLYDELFDGGPTRA
ncbi:GAF domain-containing protein [Halostella sp. JP-L12]|uniref:bacterio-opsin activator domain-containing protein n=1 Tax=Halostella TaxID=1843185 RepID=UPI000EF75D8C|nr:MULTISPECIES: bacterio-opsin activator domain-containing protein [Halostella]NHN46424.1 GAF domain-containing protein [Halostella sp. JP-L12]